MMMLTRLSGAAAAMSAVRTTATRASAMSVSAYSTSAAAQSDDGNETTVNLERTHDFGMYPGGKKVPFVSEIDSTFKIPKEWSDASETWPAYRYSTCTVI